MNKLRLYLHSTYLTMVYGALTRYNHFVLDKPYRDFNSEDITRFIVVSIVMIVYYVLLIDMYAKSKLSKKSKILIFIASLITSMILLIYLISVYR